MPAEPNYRQIKSYGQITAHRCGVTMRRMEIPCAPITKWHNGGCDTPHAIRAVRLARVFACSETTLQRGFLELGMMFRNTFGRWRCFLCGNWFWFSSQKSAHVDGSVRKAISPSKMLFAYVPFSRRKRSCSAKTQNSNPHRAFVIFYC